MTKITIRNATFDDIDTIKDLIEKSVHGLQAGEYSKSQRDAALGTVFGIDTNLFKDQTYFIIEVGGKLAGCGGWSYRKAMFGADSLTSAEPEKLDPIMDAARIRAFFIHPDFARRGLGALILEHCENEARKAGFKKCALGATLTGVPFYEKFGYIEIEKIEAPLPNGETLGVVQMGKEI
jgi:N-acetylglutamate synthase-like GNAT family acetyltransferase